MIEMWNYRFKRITLQKNSRIKNAQASSALGKLFFWKR
jgi:hypothetical protein